MVYEFGVLLRFTHQSMTLGQGFRHIRANLRLIMYKITRCSQRVTNKYPGSYHCSQRSVNICIRIKHNQTYRIIGYKQEDSLKVSVNSRVTPTLIYIESTPRFHQWRKVHQWSVYGLNFASAEMASDFAREIKIALQYVKGELEWPLPQGQSQPLPPPIQRLDRFQPVAPRSSVQLPVQPKKQPGPEGPPKGLAPDFKSELAGNNAESVAGGDLNRRKPSSQEIQTDNSFGVGTILQTNRFNVGQLGIPKYNNDSYLITGKKVCLVLVISKFDQSEHDRKYTENDHKHATEVLKRRGFEVILLVGHVTKNDFTKKLNEIKKRTDIGLFMLVVSSHGDEKDNVMFSDNSNWNNGKPRYETS